MWTPVRLAVQTLGANPLRTALSTLGIVMGAASLSAVLSLGDGAESFARRRLEGEGLQTILVSAKTADRIDGLRVPRARIVTFTPEDADALSRTLGPRVGVSLSGRTVVRWRETSHGREHAAVAQGVVTLGLTNAPRLQAGRALELSDAERGTDAAVVSASVARTLSSSGARDAVGRTLTVDTRRLRVVGVLAEPVGPDQPLVLVPFGVFAAWPVQGGADPPTIAIRAERVEAVEPLKAAVQAWVSLRFGDAVTVSATGLQRLRDVAQGILIFKLLMGAFTTIALLVGGIGIMNVLLASVLERTREIGVRRAVGARRRDIVLQFLAESIAIAGAGSLLGLAAGIGGAFIVTAVVRARTEALIYAAVTPGTVAASLAAAVLTGVVFGLYPALRAARLSPVDAIRTE